MALLTGYASIAEADATLGNTSPWSGSTPAVKQQALNFGRLYLDTAYTCNYFDPDAPSDDIKDANAYLANTHISRGLFVASPVGTTGSIKKKKVKAGSVETETEYSTTGRISGSLSDVCPEATAILGQTGLCVLTKGVSIALIRA